MTQVNEDIVTEEMEQTVENTVESNDEPQVELSEKEQLTQTRTGKFSLQMAYTDAQYFKNMLDKSEFKGSNMAYLLIVAKAEISQVAHSLKDLDKEARHDVELSSASIESINYFLENKTAIGDKAAHRVFASSMILRQSLLAIKKLDQRISEIEKNEDILNK